MENNESINNEVREERRERGGCDKIWMFVIGVLVGAVVSTGAFFAYIKLAGLGSTNSEQSMQMPGGGTPPDMPDGSSSNGQNGQPLEMPGGSNSSNSSNGSSNSSSQPPEMPSGQNNSAQNNSAQNTTQENS